MNVHYTKPAFFLTIFIYGVLFTSIVWSLGHEREQSANSISGELSPTISMELLTANILSEEKVEPEVVKETPQPEVAKIEPKTEIIPDPTVKKVIEPVKKKREEPKPVERKQERKKKHQQPSPQIQSKAQGAPITAHQQNLQGAGTSRDELAAYRSALRKEIERHKRYSQRAKMLRRQGTVVVEFILMNDGTIQNVRLHRSSGYDELDQSALAAVSRAKSVGARPAGLSAEQKVPIRFTLQ
ncbi:TonB family protein [Gallibacterium trehalosifermentans]|uniref:TonB family protein n=1 Tax=Gallibacterium trehalosifermentans TaxID=516935 RepID=A0ABV6GZV7_9PAST